MIDSEELNTVINSFNNSKLSAKEYTESLKEVDTTLLSYLKTCEKGKASTEGFDAYVKKANTSIGIMGVKSKLASVGVGILNSVLSAGISVLAGFAIEGVVKLFDYLIETPKEIAEAAQTARENIEQLSSTLNSNQKFIDESGKRFAELAQGVNMFTGENLSLSDDEYKEFLDLSTQLAEMFPSLDRKYLSNGQAIVQLSGGVNTIVSSLDEFIDRQRIITNMNIADNMPDVFDGVKSNVENIKDGIEKTKKEIEALEIKQKEAMSEFYGDYKIPISESGEHIEKVFKATDQSKFLSLEHELEKRNVDFTKEDMTIPGEKTAYVKYNFNLSDEDEAEIIAEARLQFERLGTDYTEEIDRLYQKVATETEKIGQQYDSMQSTIVAWLAGDTDYQSLTPIMQSVMQNIINGLNWDYLNFDNWQKGADYIKENYLSVFASGIDTSSITALFDESVQDLPVQEYVEKVKSVEVEIRKALADKGINIAFDLDFLEEEQADILKRVQNKLWVMPNGTTPINEMINSLSVEDLGIILELDVDGNTAREEIIRLIAEFKELAANSEIIDLTPIHTALDKIQSAYQTVSAAIEEYDANHMLSLDTIQSLLQLDDVYLATLYDENGQLQLNTESYNNLTKAMLQKMQVDMISNAASVLASLKDEDAAKKYLTDTTLDLTKATWEETYATIGLARAELQEARLRGETVDSRLEALDRLEESTRAKEALFKEAEKSLSQSSQHFYGTATQTSGGSSKPNVFDWAANSIANLNREIDNLNDKLADASLEDKVTIYEQLEEKNQALVDATGKAVDAYEDEWDKKSAKITAKQKQKIMSGEVFEIESFAPEDSEEYNNLVEAQQAYNQLQESKKTHSDAEKQQLADQEAALLNLNAIAQQKLDIISLADIDSMTAKEKNALLVREKKLLDEIYERNLKLAKSDQERKKLKKQHNIDTEENEEEQYDNERNERDNKIDYYGTRIQDIQNNIKLKELKGGQGSQKDYETMNDYLKKQVELEWDNYDAALALRDEQKFGTDEWNKYNDLVQKAQNNINSCTQAQIENNRAILELPIKELEEQNQALQKRLDYWEEYKAKVESAFSYAEYLIQNEIDILNEEKETITDSYDAQIKIIEEKKEALEDENSAKQRQIDLENAAYELEKAKQNRTVRVYRKGEGFVYEADQDEIRKAQDAYDQQVYDNTIAEYDDQIKVLNDAKEDELKVIDDEIELWEDYAEKLTKVSGLYDRLNSQRDFLKFWGESGEEDILNRDDGIIDSMGTKLFNTNVKIESIEGQIKANETTIGKIKEEATTYLETVTSVDKAQQKVNELIKDNGEELDAIEARKTKIKELKEKWDEADQEIDTSLGNIELANTEAKENEDEILKTRTEKLTEYKDTIVGLYGEIKKAVNDADSAYSKLQTTLANAQKTASQITALSNVDNNTGKPSSDGKGKTTASSTKGKVSKFHDGGIVGKTLENNLPEHLIALADSNLKPNETFAKLLNGEVVLNASQMGNMFDNLNRAYSALLPLNKRENSPIAITVGDVNVYNPDNSDMIVNEIVKELPLKVVQKLYSK